MFNPILDIAIMDIIDIVFVTVLLYTAIAWAKTTRAAFVVRGMIILAIIYIIARQLEMQLTAWIFQGFFAILLIIIVVIFQEELRQFFERIALWSLKSKSRRPLGAETVDILVRTMADFTKDRIGALIVIRGNDPLERHITGGIQLDGKLSEPLLKSIFDPHSAGHDGAVIVEGGQITRFAVYLPLSKDVGQLAKVGTRHGAALGLAELTDALCIVASEERGTISIARVGRLQEIRNFQEIGALLQDFVHQKYPVEEEKVSLKFFRANWLAKLGSLALAMGLWYIFVPGAKIVEVTHRIPVKLENLPPDLKLEAVQPTAVTATFRGLRRSFYLFDPGKLQVIVDVSMAELGRRTFHISEKNVMYPKDLTLQELSPATLRISVRRAARASEVRRG